MTKSDWMETYKAAHEMSAFWKFEDRVVVRVTGKDRARFLHGMLTADVKGLLPGKWAPANMVSQKGKLLAEMTLHSIGEEIWIDVPKAQKDSVVAALSKYKVIDQVVFTDAPELNVFLVMEKGTVHRLILKPGDPEPKGVRLSPEAYEAIRIEAGIPIYGVDIGEENLPLESAALEKGVSYTKGCYIGQETIIRVAHRGGHVARKVMGVVSGDTIPIGAVLNHGGKEVGKITSVTFSPKLGKTLGLALIHRDAFEPGTELEKGKVVSLPL